MYKLHILINHFVLMFQYDDANDMTINVPYRLLTSAAIPCYDTKINKMNDTRTAYLLGVAGTDVPLDEFEKLMFPYKVGHPFEADLLFF